MHVGPTHCCSTSNFESLSLPLLEIEPVSQIHKTGSCTDVGFEAHSGNYFFFGTTQNRTNLRRKNKISLTFKMGIDSFGETNPDHFGLKNSIPISLSISEDRVPNFCNNGKGAREG